MNSQLRVTEYRPWRSRIMVIVLLLLGIAGSFGGYQYGMRQGGFNKLIADEKIGDLNTQVRTLTEKYSGLINDNTALERTAEMDREALQEVKTALVNLQEESVGLREEIAFYKSLVKPTKMQPGLKVQSLAIKPMGDSNVYDFKLVLTHVRKQKQEIAGTVDFRVLGMLKDRQVVYALSDLSVTNDKQLEFKFTYFQSFEGSLKLPKGFTPQFVTVLLKPKGKRSKSIRRRMTWSSIL